MKRLVKKHPLAVRWLHWVNFPLLFLMIWSGLWIYWANPVYGVGFGGMSWFHFFPKAVFEQLHLTFHLAEGMAWHFFFMWFFTFNGLLYVIYLAVSGQWRILLPSPRDFPAAFMVLLHDLHLTKKQPAATPYNSAQRIAYFGVILMGGLSLVTGFAIYRPAQLYWLTRLCGGYEWARWEHFWLMMLFLLFFVIHVVQVAIAGWNNFRSMVSGYSLEDVSDGGTKS